MLGGKTLESGSWMSRMLLFVSQIFAFNSNLKASNYLFCIKNKFCLDFGIRCVSSVAGQIGIPGAPGFTGATGPAGSPGASGATGPMGQPGLLGQAGFTGSYGLPGQFKIS